jgi:NADH:ubiquinone reductase (H+-translocating)
MERYSFNKALQQGKCAGRNILKDIEGKKRRKFFYFNRGKAATIGKSKAVLECWKFKASGLTAWIMWLGIHIWFLKGLQNRIFVLIQWSWFYLFSKSDARIILNKEWKSFSKK